MRRSALSQNSKMDWRRAVAFMTVAGIALTWSIPARVAAQELAGVVALPDLTPVPGVPVELHRVSDAAGAVVDSTVSDAQGRFFFALDVDEEPGAVFLTGARFAGVLYWGPPVHATTPADLADYVVAVFDTSVVSGPADNLRTSIRHVVITPGVSGLQVEEIIDIEGLADRTLVAASDSIPVWRTELAAGARGVVPARGGVASEDLLLGQGMAGFVGALPPSGIRIVLQYIVPAADYVLRLGHATGRLEVLVMSVPGLQLAVEGVDEAQVGSDMRVPVRRFSATDLLEGATVSVRAEIEEPARARAWVWLLVAAALGAAALVSIRFAPARR